MQDNMIGEVETFVRRLTPAALRAVDLACDFLLPVLSMTPIQDPRSLAVVQALSVGCKLRQRRRRRRS